MINFQW